MALVLSSMSSIWSCSKSVVAGRAPPSKVTLMLRWLAGTSYEPDQDAAVAQPPWGGVPCTVAVVDPSVAVAEDEEPVVAPPLVLPGPVPPLEPELRVPFEPEADAALTLVAGMLVVTPPLDAVALPDPLVVPPLELAPKSEPEMALELELGPAEAFEPVLPTAPTPPEDDAPARPVVAPAEVTMRAADDVAQVRAFVLEVQEPIVLHRGTWHWGPYPIGADSVELFNVQGLRYAEDNAMVDLAERVLAVEVLVGP